MNKKRVIILLLISLVLAVVIDVHLPDPFRLPLRLDAMNFTTYRNVVICQVPVGNSTAAVSIEYTDSAGEVYLSMDYPQTTGIVTADASITKSLYTPCGATPTADQISVDSESQMIYAGIVNAGDSVLTDGKTPQTTAFKLNGAVYKVWYVVRGKDSPPPVVKDGGVTINIS